MELSIIQRVAKLVTSTKLDPAYNGKDGNDRKVKADSVTLSETASEYRKVNDAVAQIADPDPERAAKVQRLREAIENGQYRMSERMVNSIAERIANSLI